MIGSRVLDPLEKETGAGTHWVHCRRQMAESARTVNRRTPTREAVVVLDLLRGGDVELARKHGLS